MSQHKAGQSGPMSDHAELLQSARQSVLRTREEKDLRTLIIRLEVACEAARVAAVHALHEPTHRAANDEARDHNFGFADLFSALRRTRTEVARREIDLPDRIASSPPKRPRPVHSPRGSLSSAILAQQKARR